MKTTKHDQLTSQLCAEIDELREAVAYYKEQAEHWRDEHSRLVQSQIKSGNQLMGGLLSLALKGKLHP